MVLDYSGSMSSSISVLETAAKSFIGNKRENDRISMVRFDESVVPEIELTKDKNEILNTVIFNGLLNFGGTTALYAAMSDGIESLKNNDNRTKEMIVFTDGYENSSMFYMGSKAVTAQELAKLANENNIRINIISFGNCVNANLLDALAGYTGGNYYPVSDNTEISGVWTELPYVKRNYYVIKFKSSDITKINGVKLSYNDNTGKNFTIGKKIYVNDSGDFGKYEVDSSAYWIKHLPPYNKKTPISAPQVVALFNLNGSVAMEQYIPKIDSLVSFMKSDTSVCIAIFGHTDLSDTKEYNDILSSKRCDFVKNYLVKEGIDEKRIYSIPLGELYPVWNDEKESWQAQENRRIEVVLLQ